ncbi:MAG TPA: hypothetical protein VNW99_08275, partial [Cytophagaceae bacterium]|nr:hypothetical protein [Cytophagaceae bacterium]
MKKILLLVAAFISFNAASFAQSAYSIEPIMKLGVAFVDQIEVKYPGIIVQKAEFDFALNDNYTYIDMSDKLDYVVAGIGDDNVADISLIVYKKVEGAWVKLKEDSEVKNSAFLEIDPSYTGEYAIDIKINKYVAGKTSGH